MRRTILTLLALLPVPLHAAGQYTPEQIRAAVRQAGGPERFMSALATNTAKMSGQMLDDQTQITGAVANDRTLVYYLRLVNHNKVDIPDLPAFRKKVASMLSPSVCTAPIASIVINEHGAEYKYMVYSKNREFLFDYALNRTTCSPGYVW